LHISHRGLLGEAASQVILRMAGGSVGDGMRAKTQREKEKSRPSSQNLEFNIPHKEMWAG
jgi:hypothetical protein